MTMPIPNPVFQALTIAKIVVAVIILCVIGYVGFRIKSLEATNAEQATEIVEYKNANDDWKTKTDSANAAIKQLQDETAAAEKAVADAQKQAAVVQQSANDSAKKIEATVPQSPDDCAATKKLTDAYYGKKRP